MRAKNDEIRTQKPFQTPDGGVAVVVSFRKAGWSNFSRRKFVATTEADAMTLAKQFMIDLQSMADWHLAAREPRLERHPVKRRPIARGSVFWSPAYGKFLATCRLGKDSRGKQVVRVWYRPTKEDAEAVLDRFVKDYNSKI